MNDQMKRFIGEVWKGPVTGASVLEKLGCTVLPARESVHQPGSSYTFLMCGGSLL